MHLELLDRRDFVQDLRRKLRIVAFSAIAAGLATYAIVWGKAAWELRELRNAFAAQRREAEQLGLTYQAVLLAPDKMVNRPVLWRLGKTAREWSYQGDKDKPVVILNPPDLPHKSKGMDLWTVLAVVRGAGPQGVFVEYLRNYEVL